MWVIAGSIEVEPSAHAAYIANRLKLMAASRAEPGCIDYSLSEDPIDPSKIILLERWESEAHFEAHMVPFRAEDRPAPPSSAGLVSRDATCYEATPIKSLW